MNVVWWVLVVQSVFVEKLHTYGHEEVNTTKNYAKVAEGTLSTGVKETPTQSSNEIEESPTVGNTERFLLFTDQTTHFQVGNRMVTGNPKISNGFVTIQSRNEISDSTFKDEETTEDSSSPSDEPSSTSEISSSVSTSPNELIEETCPEIPEVPFTSIVTSAYEVTLEWEIPSDIQCWEEYVIYLNDEEKDRIDVNFTEFIIKDLNACTEYTVAIALSSGSVTGNTTKNSFNTTLPENFNSYQVSNFAVKEESGFLMVSWDESAKEISQCITNYALSWWDGNDESSNEGRGDDNIDGAQSSYNLPAIGCMKYVVQIIPKHVVGDANLDGRLKQTSYDAASQPTQEPSIVSGTLKPDKTKFTVIWNIDGKSKNKCNLTEIIVTCEAQLDKNSNYSWLVGNATAVQPIHTVSADNRYSMSVDPLSPFTNYSCEGVVVNSGGNSMPHEFEVLTNEEVPPAPASLTITNVESHNFTIQWTEPVEIPGIMTKYVLEIKHGGPLDDHQKKCSSNGTDQIFDDIDPQTTQYKFSEGLPYHQYTIILYGVDGAGDGATKSTTVSTKPASPDPVATLETDPPEYSTTEEYNAKVRVKFDPPCNMNGPFKFYEIIYDGQREFFDPHTGNFTTNETHVEIIIKPERSYTFKVTVVTDDYRSSSLSTPVLFSKSGVPRLAGTIQLPAAKGTSTASFTLNKTAFSDEMGDIIAYALLLGTSSISNESFGFWEGDNETWPALPQNVQQLTPNFWNPFNDGATSFNCMIGADKICSNTALNADTEYRLFVRALTRDAYKDSPPLRFKTDMLNDLDLGLILGLTFGILAALVLIGFLVVLWRRKQKSAVFEEEKRPSNSIPAPLPVQKFDSYYANIKENYDIIKQQFIDLGIQSKEGAGEITYAVLPENRRKNRWTNILPYDSTRVTLKIDEDDEISSDYINASFIKGYSGKVEYIATQGPLELTARDFWKMILQENVSIIVMVAQFVEQSKEKCHHYFPNNHETMNFGESLEVKCSTELHFGTYCIRTLQVRKGVEQRDIVHMQFLEWPDFGVPQGTDNMLQFCNQLREKVNKEGGLIVVHCSAGVGRTGTLIALDILLQTIDNHRDINVYKTVLDLRKQRTNMVQTEKQYMYIHTCVKDYIEAPKIPTNEVEQERIYENMEVLRSSLKKNLIEADVESAL